MSLIDRIIKNEADYQAALKVVSALIDADPKRGTPDADRLEVMGTLLEAYEAKHYPLENQMNVEQLIEQLRQLPGDLPVLVEGYETGWDGIHELRTDDVVRYLRAQEWDGEYRDASEFKQTGKPALLIVGRRRGFR